MQHKKKYQLGIRLVVFSMLMLMVETTHAMHIGEGFLSATSCICWGVMCIPFLGCGIMKMNRHVKEDTQTLVFLAMAGAFTFVLSALKIPSVTGSSSHMTGLGFATILFGPLIAGVLALVVLLFQAVLLAHGGLTTLGANTFSMGIAGPFVAFVIYAVLMKMKTPRSVSIFCAAALGSLATYLMTSLQLAMVYPNEVGGVSASFAKFAAVFALTQIPLAVIEGILTVVLVNIISTYAPDLLNSSANKGIICE